MKKGLVAVVIIAGFTVCGAGVGIVYPYAKAIFGEDQYEQDEAMDYILNEDLDAWKTRAVVGSAAGGGLMFLFLLTRKGPESE